MVVVLMSLEYQSPTKNVGPFSLSQQVNIGMSIVEILLFKEFEISMLVSMIRSFLPPVFQKPRNSGILIAQPVD